MPYRRTLGDWFDRPGSRWLLGKVATSYVRRILRDDVEILHLNGLWTHRIGSIFFPDGRTFASVYSNFGNWKTEARQYASEAAEFWLKHYWPKQGDVIVDVGAGRGEDTLTFSRAVGKIGRVIAIEASPLSFAMLQNFCLLNGLANVTALHVALMNKRGTVRLRKDQSTWKQDSIVGGDESSGIEVEGKTLDQICQEMGINQIALLKMNIEGGERHALLGMDSVLPHIRQICVACHDFRSAKGDGEQFRTRAFVEQFLTKHGFSLTSDPDDPRDYVRDHVFGMRSGPHSLAAEREINESWGVSM